MSGNHQKRGRFPALELQVQMETVDHLRKADWVTMINVHSEQSEQHSLWIRVAIIALLLDSSVLHYGLTEICTRVLQFRD